MPNLTRMLAGVLIAVAVLLGVLAITLARRPAPAVVTATAQPTFAVVVAARPLPAGKPIPADALRVQSLPINPNGAFSDPGQLAGRVPNADIGAQTPVLETQLSSGIAEHVEPGERALAVRVDESNAVANRLRPGNFVDVFFTLKRDNGLPGSTEVDHTQARLLLSKVRVLAFGNATAGGDAAADPNATVRTAVLAVPVADVDRLTLAESAGRLIFALRNPKDPDIVDESAFAALPGVIKTAARSDAATPLQGSTKAAAGVSLDALAGAGNVGAAAPRLAPPVPHPPMPMPMPMRTAGNANSTKNGIEVIRGGRAETVAW
ncbi:Flp pilus assembly protein CpaB [Paraburkholderia sp. PREW-6R]|uniref:Flp pilus assembly protein CpaB n=1 Tax=Paraburkholderia sp. PREW-6R TaxID=3141544 RepID=UPI0031F59E62